MRILIFLSYFLFYTGFALRAQVPFNNVDSKGLKQGCWQEFKSLPTKIEIDGDIMYDPADSSKIYVLDKRIFDDNCIAVNCIGHYENGLKIGTWIEYFPNGNIKSKVDYKDGVPNGQCNVFWNNGFIRIKCYLSCDNHVLVTSYNLSGEFLSKLRVHKKEVIKFLYTR